MFDFMRSSALLLLLLNPFLVVVYLIDVMEKLDGYQFRQVLLRAGIIAGAVFCLFSILGDVVFSDIIQVEFASFQIFGGIVFLIIGLQFFFRGPRAIEMLRGESEHLTGAIAMPVLIGPGTISASVLIGKRHDPMLACSAVLFAVVCTVVIILLLKTTHDVVRTKKEPLVQRYIEIAGRVTALYVGTVSIEMIMQGLCTWACKLWPGF